MGIVMTTLPVTKILLRNQSVRGPLMVTVNHEILSLVKDLRR